MTEIYVGASAGHAQRQCLENTEDWKFICENVDGWYVNNFALRRPQAEEHIRIIAEKIKSGAVYYETDFRHATQEEDDRNLTMLMKYFDVKYCNINQAAKATLEEFAQRRDTLKKGNPKRHVHVMVAPWQVGGNFFDPGFKHNKALQNLVKRVQGTATDGPLSLWRRDQGHMVDGSVSTVKYCDYLNKNFTPMIMMAPNETNGLEFFDAVRDCVRTHEVNNAVPDIWVMSFYGPPFFHNCPVMPESWRNDGNAKQYQHGYPWDNVLGQNPAQTFMGATWWLINHIKDPTAWPSC